MPRADHRRLAVIAAIAAAGSYGLMAIGALPLLVTHWVSDLGLGEQSAGLVAAANVTGATLGLALCLWLVTRSTLPVIAAAGVLIAASGDLTSLAANDVALLCVTRLLAGFGMGLVSASVTNWIARRDDADRGFGLLMFFQFVTTSALFFAVPPLRLIFGSSAIHVCLLAAAALAFFCIPLLKLNDRAASLLRQDLPRRERPVWRFSHLAFAGACAIAAQALFELAGVGIWAYEHRYGAVIGLGETQAADLLALATLMGIPASLLVIWLGNRFGRLAPILIGLAGYTLPVLFYALHEPPALGYALGLGVMNAAWCLVIPYFQAAQSALDRSGRTAMTGVLVASLAGGVGPALFGLTVNGANFAPMFSLAAIILVLAAAAAIPAAVAADHLRQDSAKIAREASTLHARTNDNASSEDSDRAA